MKRTTYRKKSTAKRARGAGRRVYKTDGDWRVSPECPRKATKRLAVKRQRIKTRRKRRPKYTDEIPF